MHNEELPIGLVCSHAQCGYENIPCFGAETISVVLSQDCVLKLSQLFFGVQLLI